jgi:hypothetical protein|tara:strand:- start:1567 stop:1971 length:405 start_codon:yes stop_codon:yes gene_type:complete
MKWINDIKHYAEMIEAEYRDDMVAIYASFRPFEDFFEGWHVMNQVQSKYHQPGVPPTLVLQATSERYQQRLDFEVDMKGNVIVQYISLTQEAGSSTYSDECVTDEYTMTIEQLWLWLRTKTPQAYAYAKPFSEE